MRAARKLFADCLQAFYNATKIIFTLLFFRANLSFFVSNDDTRASSLTFSYDTRNEKYLKKAVIKIKDACVFVYLKALTYFTLGVEIAFVFEDMRIY